MKLRPLHDRVIVKRLEEERKTASGIVIPDTAAEKPDQGEVLAIGPGKKNEDGKVSPVDVKVGDTVLFGKYSGTTVKVDGDELLVMLRICRMFSGTQFNTDTRYSSWQLKKSNLPATHASAWFMA